MRRQLGHTSEAASIVKDEVTSGEAEDELIEPAKPSKQVSKQVSK